MPPPLLDAISNQDVSSIKENDGGKDDNFDGNTQTDPKPVPLFLPNHMETLEYQDDGTVSGALLYGDDSTGGEGFRTLLCGPLPFTKENLLAWFMRGKSTEYERPIPQDLAKYQAMSKNTTQAKELKVLWKNYHRRREEMRELAAKFVRGEATIDVDGRLVPLPEVDDEDEDGQRNQAANEERNGNAGVGDDRMQNDPMFGDDPGLMGAFLGLGNDFLQEEEMMRRVFDRQEAEAEEAIAEAVERYKREGVPEEDYEVILVPPIGTKTKR